jgi:predicted nucleotidyltransferase
MTTAMIDFPSVFTQEQLDYIGQCVVEAAQQVCGDKLRDVILYGSYARGDFEEWSDVDIMVLFDGDDLECKKIDDTLMRTLFELDNRMNLLLYIIVTPYTRFVHMKEDYPFYRNVNREGKRLCSQQIA